MKQVTFLYVQYGCGFCAPAGWLNFDASLTLRFERIPIIGHLYSKNDTRFPDRVQYGDIVAGLPVAKASCRGIFCSHVLEHLSKDDCETALKNTFDYLEPGGRFRLVLPDLRILARKYLASDSSGAAHDFMTESGLGIGRRAKGFGGNLSRVLGKSQHLWLWDAKSLSDALRRAGFERMRLCVFNDSEDERFREVESWDRFRECLSMEAVK